MDSVTCSPSAVNPSYSTSAYYRGGTTRKLFPLSRAMGRGHSDLHDEMPVANTPQEDHATEPALLPPESTRPVLPSLAIMSHAHVSEYTTVTTVPRYNHASPSLHICDPASPCSSASPTTNNSRAPSPSFEDPAISRRVLNSPKWRLACGYFACFVLGWGDGVTGTVMPHLIAEFKLTTMTSSLLWVGGTCGFFAGTFLVESILKYLGRCKLDLPRKCTLPCIPKVSNIRPLTPSHSPSRARHLALIIAGTIHTSYFIMVGSRSGFPVMFVGYAVAAFARALLTAPLNGYLATCPKRALGFSFGLSSLGSVASSFVCQSIIATGVPWFHFYFGSLVLSGVNITFLALAFKPSIEEIYRESSEGLSEKIGFTRNIPINGFGPSPIPTAIVAPPPSTTEFKVDKIGGGRSALRMALRMPYQWAFSMFALLYCGSETTTQGFMVIYLLGMKNANPKTVGYVTSGFWGGVSLGRFTWGCCTEFGNALCMSAFLGLVLQILVWVVPSPVHDSIAAGFIGLFYGPILPAALAMANDILPEEVHMTVMALINAFASLGGAIFPLITGTTLSFKGVSAFTPIAVTLTSTLVVLWALFPSQIPAPTIV